MQAMSALTEAELRIPRSARDLLPWVQHRIQQIASTEAGIATVRFRRGPAKKLMEEALPLGIFAAIHYRHSHEVMLTHVLEHQSYDATVEDIRTSPSPINYIEVTQAHEGETDFHRRLALVQNGYVNHVGPIKKTGTRATNLSVESKMVVEDFDDPLKVTAGLVEEALNRKVKIGSRYDSNTALIIAFDDYIPFQKDRDEATLTHLVERHLPMLRPFSWIALVGWSGRTFIEFDNSK
jgi:hypothetical protein